MKKAAILAIIFLGALPLAANAAVSFDAASAGGGCTSSCTSLSWSHTTTSTTDRYLLVAVGGDSAGSISGITYNGVAMTKLFGQASGGDGRLYVFGLAAPAAGANTVQVTGSGTFTLTGVSETFTGVNQGSPLMATSSKSTGAVTFATTTLTTVATGTMVFSAIEQEQNGTFNATAPLIEGAESGVSGNRNAVAGYQDTSSTVASTTQRWNIDVGSSNMVMFSAALAQSTGTAPVITSSRKIRGMGISR